jgi:triosephosphate isomerase
VGGNWKMHHLRADAEGWCRSVLAAGSPLAAAERAGAGAAAGAAGEAPVEAPVEAVVFPSFPLLATVEAGLAGSGVAWGGQDLHPADRGAHTGDVSGGQLADLGCSWVLCGHSERRHDHGEGDDLVAEKVRAALRHRLAPLVCVGETREERRAGHTWEVLDRQLDAALAALPRPEEGAAPWALAYEPVWAIGTGETATPALAQEAHAHLRQRLRVRLGEPAAARLRLVYGGSVKPDNAAELYAGEDVDGFLVGGASLDPGAFLAIIARCV